MRSFLQLYVKGCLKTKRYRCFKHLLFLMGKMEEEKQKIETEDQLLNVIKGLMLESWMTPSEKTEDLAKEVLDLVRLFYVKKEEE